jgi:hypothetical protein
MATSEQRTAKMDSTAFEFSLRLPGDARLVGAVRDLTAHAATYARLEPSAADGLADQVLAATEAAVRASGAQDAPLDFHFVREGGTLTISIGVDAAVPAAWPPSAREDMAVDSARQGTRDTCLITQRLA